MSNQATGKPSIQAFAQLLLHARVVTREQLQQAAAECKSNGCGLSHALVALGLVDETTLLRALSHHYRVKAVDLSRVRQLDPALLKTVRAGFARHHMVLPVRRLNGALSVAMPNPADERLVQALTEATGLRIEPVVATEFALRKAVDKHYPAERLPQTAERTPAAPKPATPTAVTPPAATPPVAIPPVAAVAAAPALAVAPTNPVLTAVPDDSGTASTATDEDAEELERKRAEAEAAVAFANFAHSHDGVSTRKNGKKQLGFGLVMLLLGAIVTVASYNSAELGGTYIVTTGLFLVGIINAIRGVNTLLTDT
jgi:hypothetical protein